MYRPSRNKNSGPQTNRRRHRLPPRAKGAGDSGAVLRAPAFIRYRDMGNKICIAMLHRETRVWGDAERTEKGNVAHRVHFVSAQAPVVTRGQVLHGRRHFFFFFFFFAPGSAFMLHANI